MSLPLTVHSLSKRQMTLQTISTPVDHFSTDKNLAFQDLIMHHGWSVKKSHCQFANQVKGKFKTHFWYFVESVAGLEQ